MPLSKRTVELLALTKPQDGTYACTATHPDERPPIRFTVTDGLVTDVNGVLTKDWYRQPGRGLVLHLRAIGYDVTWETTERKENTA